LENQKAGAFCEIKREGSLLREGEQKKEEKKGRREGLKKRKKIILSCHSSLEREMVEERKSRACETTKRGEQNVRRYDFHDGRDIMLHKFVE